MIKLPKVIRVLPLDLLDEFDRKINNERDEKNIIIISHLKDMTFSHQLDQPKSMLCRKLVINFTEEDFGEFDCNWLANCFKKINFNFLTSMNNFISKKLNYINDCY